MITISGKSATLGATQFEALLAPTLAALNLGQECRIVNNAIALIDQIDIERETHDLDDAIVIAAKKRVTSVMLTSLTTVLGLVPMALSGGALFEPMATLMVGGLLLVSPLTLFFVLPAYRLFLGCSGVKTPVIQPVEATP
jgi:Cu/Ag efflux pump CusA